MPQATSQKSLTYAREQVGKDPVAKLLGIELEELSHLRTVVALTPQPHHLNAMGVVHGSIIYALLDQAAAIACNAFEYQAILCQGRIDFLNTAAPENKLRATAIPLSIKRRISVWDIKIIDEQGVLVAAGQAMAYHFV